ncbi:hypothetical protein LTR37_009096 [Vermiconidia calcicola]|uniref:Uncharacterized protein n=1 Tax=Vermiconidia calcicola TaxID=1690605 RepID=A0ACC3N8K6_9PEZI|nr:hypothetical protein LTR37_009096 [Vermiconidia calcicola]
MASNPSWQQVDQSLSNTLLDHLVSLSNNLAGTRVKESRETQEIHGIQETNETQETLVTYVTYVTYVIPDMDSPNLTMIHHGTIQVRLPPVRPLLLGNQCQVHNSQGSHTLPAHFFVGVANSCSVYGSMPAQYDQYGRPIQSPQGPFGAPDPGYQPVREPAYGRERQPAPTTGGDRDRDARRRRLH